MEWPPSEPGPVGFGLLASYHALDESLPGDPGFHQSSPAVDNVESLEEWENQQYLPPPRSHRQSPAGRAQAHCPAPEHCSSPAVGGYVAPDSLHASAGRESPRHPLKGATFRERNASMLCNEAMADAWFLVGSDGKTERIPVHTYVLAVGSSVFSAMFYGVFPLSSEICVPDVEPEAFKNMLRYLYADEVCLNSDNVMSTLYVAKKYLIDHLIRACVAFLEESLNSSNVCFLLSQSRLFEEQQLLSRCWEVVDAQTEIALNSDSFLEIDLETLRLILSRETLNARESVIYECAVRWAQNACRRAGADATPDRIREALGSAFRLIRFPAMRPADLANLVAKSGLLTADEMVEIFLHHYADEKPPLAFPTKARVGLPLKRCHRFQSCAYRGNQWRYRGRCDSIQFCTDRRIFIAGFGLYGSSNGAAKYGVRFELKRSGQVLAALDASFNSDGSSKVFPVFFEQPIQIEADVYYTAGIVLEGNELSHFGQEGLPEVQVQDVTFQFQVSTESTNGTGVQGGQIPEILFY